MTDTTINYISSHPTEHKLAAYRYYIERMLNLNNRQHKEWQTILNIAKANNFPTTLIHKLRQKTQYKIMRATPQTQKTTRNGQPSSFLSHTRKITNLFKHTNLKIAIIYHNTIAPPTKPATDHKTPPHSKAGIYQLTCKSCNL